ncbi:MAG: GAF domain-containing protein [Anaerolineae bacterium]|nr:GAF domain-containing protein [Anaerolineae bacterium]
MSVENPIPAGRLPSPEDNLPVGVDRHTYEQPALLHISSALASATDPEVFYSTVLETIIPAYAPADAGTISLWDEEEKHLVVRAALGYENVTLRCRHFRKGESLPGKVFAAQAPQLFPTPQAIVAAGVNTHPEDIVYEEKATGAPVCPRSALGVPLMLGEEIIGVLLLEQWQPAPPFAAADIPLLQTLANLAALAADRLRLQMELERTHADAQADLSSLDLLSTLAHEMRTPLASIKGYSTALILEEVQWDPEKQAEFLRIIDEETDKLEEIINDLLESSLIEAGRLEITPEPILLPRLVHEIVDEMLHRTDKHRFVISFPSDFPIVEADPRRIHQVLHNLLDNAVKYSPHGGLVVIRGEVSQSEVVISVADQGIGIAPEHLNRLFERFFRAREIEEHVAGSGLGLPIARAIVQSHGGRIWAESKLGEGSTFYFTLPLGEQSSALAEE